MVKSPSFLFAELLHLIPMGCPLSLYGIRRNHFAEIVNCRKYCNFLVSSTLIEDSVHKYNYGTRVIANVQYPRTKNNNLVE